MVAGNIFGDILSDAAAMLTGSIGMLPSASLGTRLDSWTLRTRARDGTGHRCRDIANPLAAILSVAMLLRRSFGQGVQHVIPSTAPSARYCAKAIAPPTSSSKGCKGSERKRWATRSSRPCVRREPEQSAYEPGVSKSTGWTTGQPAFIWLSGHIWASLNRPSVADSERRDKRLLSARQTKKIPASVSRRARGQGGLRERL